MEEPRRREEAEKIAEMSRKEAERMEKVRQEAEKIKRAIDRVEAGPSGTARPKKKPAHGDYALGPDGEPDYANCPFVNAPPGMEAVITVKNGRWDVAIIKRGS
jgi:hypothetical protein